MRDEHLEAIVDLLIGLISVFWVLGNRETWEEGERQGQSVEHSEYVLIKFTEAIIIVTSKISDHRSPWQIEK